MGKIAHRPHKEGLQLSALRVSSRVSLGELFRKFVEQKIQIEVASARISVSTYFRNAAMSVKQRKPA